MFQRIIRFCVKLVQKYLPEPFIFAVILTMVAFIVAMPVCKQTPIEVVEHWGNGVWIGIGCCTIHQERHQCIGRVAKNSCWCHRSSDGHFGLGLLA